MIWRSSPCRSRGHPVLALPAPAREVARRDRPFARPVALPTGGAWGARRPRRRIPTGLTDWKTRQGPLPVAPRPRGPRLARSRMSFCRRYHVPRDCGHRPGTPAFKAPSVSLQPPDRAREGSRASAAGMRPRLAIMARATEPAPSGLLARTRRPPYPSARKIMIAWRRM